jgi:leucyl aminopeptidase (aminopeptidase T)
MSLDTQSTEPPDFERWIPLARKVVRQSLDLRWDDVLEVYSYIPTIPLAEALALEARRAGSDTHITLMTDDLWFTSMQELPAKWLRAPSPVEIAINRAITAYIYLGGPRDARRMQNIPPEKFDANSLGNVRQDEPRRKRRVRHIDLPIGRLCPERAEAYGLDYELWRKSYEAALAANLEEIQKAGEEWRSKLEGQRKVRITSDAGTNLTFKTKPLEPMVEDGIISKRDRKHGFVSTSLPAGKIICAVQPTSARGEVHFTDPVFMMGRSVNGLRLRLEEGRLVDWGADEHAQLLASLLRQGKINGDQMGWFSVGLNPAAEPCMLDNSVVKNDIGIGLGPHPILEPSRIMSRSYFDGTVGLGNVEVLD